MFQRSLCLILISLKAISFQPLVLVVMVTREFKVKILRIRDHCEMQRCDWCIHADKGDSDFKFVINHCKSEAFMVVDIKENSF